MIPVLFDTTALQAEHDDLLQETQVVSDMVRQCIYENAHVALDQAEYQKRYDGLTQRFDKAKARLEAVAAEIHEKKTQRASYEAFLKAFEKQPDQLTEFTLDSWNGLVDYATVYAEEFGGECITYEGIGSTKKWERLDSYGPKFVENIVQATSRDILCYAMKTLRCCSIVMHIHDELVIEADPRMSLDVLCEQMGRTPPWAKGLKLCADGYITPFYKKD